MAKGFKHGAGGSTSLNFKVVGGTSAPSNPKENTIWVNTSTEITSWDFSATEPTKRSKNKNMVLVDASTTTKNGVTFTVNSDGSITVNGTASAGSEMRICSMPVTRLLEVGKTYTLKGTGDSNIGIGIHERTAADSWVKTHAQEYIKDVTFTYNGVSANGNEMYVYLYVPSGRTVSSVIVYPQLEKGSTATSFVKGDATGQVWFTTGPSSIAPFNALKKNGIQVYPLSAKQSVSDAWTTKTVKVYKNGAWVDLWNGVLLDPNVTSNDYTGGWIGDSSIPIFTSTDRTHKEATATYGSNNVTLSMSGKSEGSYRTVKKVDVSGFNTLTVDVSSATAPNGFIVVFVSNKLNTNAWENSAAITPIIDKTTSGAKTVTLDISAVNGEHYIGVALAAYDTKAVTTNITKISLT